MIVVSYGGGTNSTALLIGMVERGIKADLILFADTGGERPETYAYVKMFSDWLVIQGQPPITTVRKQDKYGNILTLEQHCLIHRCLPSLAYGFKKCSLKFKVQPQDKYCNNWQPTRGIWKRGDKVTKFIGFDAGEDRRATRFSDDKKYAYQYPLIEWVWGREECRAAIERAGLPQPGKSACFFCPSTKKYEVLELRNKYPDLLQRALVIESYAELTKVAGLGRGYAWRDLLKADEQQLRLWPDNVIEQTCGCYDG